MKVSERQRAATQCYNTCLKEIQKLYPQMPRVMRKELARRATNEGMKEFDRQASAAAMALEQGENHDGEESSSKEGEGPEQES